MRLIRRLIGLIVVLALVLVAGAYLLPREVSVARSTVINAPPAAVYRQVNSLQNFAGWSPWGVKDPAMKITHDGAAEGVGARMAWTSDNPAVGSGTQEITETTPDERVVYKLGMDGMAPSFAYFDLAAQGNATEVTWTLAADMGMNPVARWMGLMMDGWVGPDFEAGLARLKSAAEAG